MDEVLKALKTIKMELDEQRREIRETGKIVTEQVTKNINSILDEKFLVWEHKHENLKEIVENQEKRIYFLEIQVRKKNLVFFGIEEIETSYESLEKNTMKWLEQYFSIKLTYSDIEEVKRIGKKSERPRPLVVTFSTLGLKIKILKQKDALKDTTYYFKEDYPKQVLEKRKELQDQVRLEKEKGNIVKIKYDKLVIIKPSQKRQLQTSPSNDSNLQNKTNTHINKKNKMQKTHSTVLRSNSVSEGTMKPSMLNFIISKKSHTTNAQENDTELLNSNL